MNLFTAQRVGHIALVLAILGGASLLQDAQAQVAQLGVEMPNGSGRHYFDREPLTRWMFGAIANYVKGDMDGDGAVTLADVVVVLDGLGEGAFAGQWIIPGDANLDGIVDVADVALVVANIGEMPSGNGDELFEQAILSGVFFGWGNHAAGDMADDGPPHYSAVSSSYPTSHTTWVSVGWPNNHSYTFSATRPTDHSSSFSGTWPGNHTINISLSWNPSHSVTASRSYSPNHHQSVSAGYLNPPIHEVMSSARWPSNHVRSQSLDHQQEQSNIQRPENNHLEAFSGNWDHSEYDSRNNRYWPNNHWAQISGGWSPHSQHTSGQWTPNHMQFPSSSWPDTENPQNWPPGHFSEYSVRWGHPGNPNNPMPPVWPPDHSIAITVGDIKNAIQFMAEDE